MGIFSQAANQLNTKFDIDVNLGQKISFEWLCDVKISFNKVIFVQNLFHLFKLRSKRVNYLV